MTPAEIVHHKIELTPDNIDNPKITLGFDNLEAVCRDCHASIHQFAQRKRRYIILEDGRVMAKDLLRKNK